MASVDPALGGHSNPAESAEMLRKILEHIQGSQRRRWAEIISAVILSLATMGSAWCAYQSNLWGGVQTFRLADAGKAGREASKNAIQAVEFRAFDAIMLIHFVEARLSGNKPTEQFLYPRFRPEMKPALDAWLAADPFSSPAAPPTPFKMPQYVQAEVQAGALQAEHSAAMMGRAEEANEWSDRYVMMTVLFASVLFFGGIGGTFEARWLRLTMGIIAIVFFLVTTSLMLQMPICHE